MRDDDDEDDDYSSVRHVLSMLPRSTNRSMRQHAIEGATACWNVGRLVHKQIVIH